MDYATFSNGVKMPMEGIGVFQIPDHATAVRVVKDAMDVGYRMIDTAAAYMNERAVGEGIRESGVKRDGVFVTSKIWVQDFGYEATKKAIDRSLDKLGFDYLDLMLLHQPVGDYMGSWRALEEALEEGKLRAIGMANCYPHVITDLCLTMDVKPMLNQVEIHPFFQQQRNLDAMREYGVVPQAWGSLAEGRKDLFESPILNEIGAAHGKSAAQVALRWAVDRGIAIIPKSVRKERLQENLDIWNFKLSKEEISRIAEMDTGHSEIVDHFDPAFIKMLHGFRLPE